MQTEADRDSSIDPVQHGTVNSAPVLPPPWFGSGTHRLPQEDRGRGPAALPGCQLDVGG